MPKTAPITIVLKPFARFMEQEASSGIFLFLCTVLAFAWANSPWSEAYFAYWHGTLSVGAGPFTTEHSIHHWINDGLMAIFFFVMGMEIKRELLTGELSNARAAALPILAALGGVIAPAAIFSAVNLGGPSIHGWAIPTATDIAFSLGVLAVLGDRIPVSLKIFLAALAIADDLFAVVVIALFYSGSLSIPALISAAIWLAAAFLLNWLGIRTPAWYAFVGAGLWVSVLNSGIHATIAGVLLALAIPARSVLYSIAFVDQARELLDRFARHIAPDQATVHQGEALEALHVLERKIEMVQAPLMRFEYALHPWVSFGIMPLFALANAGVRVFGDGTPNLLQPGAIGTFLGLLLGKPLGITLFSWLAVRAGWATLPSGVTWRSVHGVSWLAGIGFTMSIFIGELAFGESPALAATKIAIVAASVLAGCVGAWLLYNAHTVEAAVNEVERDGQEGHAQPGR